MELNNNQHSNEQAPTQLQPLQNLGTKQDSLVQHRSDYATNQPDKKAVLLCPEKTSPQVIYRAVGWVAGTYKPSEAKFYQGVLVTEDGLTIPSELTRQLRSRLKKEHAGYASDPDFFKEPFRWTVYPRTDPVEFHLVAMRPLTPVPADAPGLDSFRVVGLIKSCSDGVATVRIQRNQEPPQRWKHHNEWKPIVLTLEGSVVPPEALGQIWDLEVQRSGERLLVKAGRPYEPSAEDLAWLEKQFVITKTDSVE